MFNDAVPLAGDGILDAIGSIRIDVDDVTELGNASDLVQQFHREAVEPVIARVVLTVVQHDVRPLLCVQFPVKKKQKHSKYFGDAMPLGIMPTLRKHIIIERGGGGNKEELFGDTIHQLSREAEENVARYYNGKSEIQVMAMPERITIISCH